MEYAFFGVIALYGILAIWMFYTSFRLTDRTFVHFFTCILTGLFWPFILGWYFAARISNR